MVMKLQRAGAATAPATEERRVPAGWGAPKPTEAAAAPMAEAAQPQITAAAPTEERKVPAGWGRPAGAAPSEAQEQRAAIQEKLNPQTAEEVVQAAEQTTAFSDNVIALKASIEGTLQTAEEAAEQQARVTALVGDATQSADNSPLPEPTKARAGRGSAAPTVLGAPIVNVGEGAVNLPLHLNVPVRVEQHAPPADEELLHLQKLELLTRCLANIGTASAAGVPEDVFMPFVEMVQQAIAA